MQEYTPKHTTDSRAEYTAGTTERGFKVTSIYQRDKSEAEGADPARIVTVETDHYKDGLRPCTCGATPQLTVLMPPNEPFNDHIVYWYQCECGLRTYDNYRDKHSFNDWQSEEVYQTKEGEEC